MKNIVIKQSVKQELTPILYNRLVNKVQSLQENKNSGEFELKLKNKLKKIKYLVKENSIILF